MPLFDRVKAGAAQAVQKAQGGRTGRTGQDQRHAGCPSSRLALPRARRGHPTRNTPELRPPTRLRRSSDSTARSPITRQSTKRMLPRPWTPARPHPRPSPTPVPVPHRQVTSNSTDCLRLLSETRTPTASTRRRTSYYAVPPPALGRAEDLPLECRHGSHTPWPNWPSGFAPLPRHR